MKLLFYSFVFLIYSSNLFLLDTYIRFIVLSNFLWNIVYLLNKNVFFYSKFIDCLQTTYQANYDKYNNKLTRVNNLFIWKHIDIELIYTKYHIIIFSARYLNSIDNDLSKYFFREYQIIPRKFTGQLLE